MKQLKDVKILVVGDIMLDKYVVGDVSRLSPEAPVPIVNVKEEYYTIGGCGNVVRNVRELGVQVDCLASIGLDRNGEKIADELDRIGARYFPLYGSRQTTVKERIIADERKVQMLRIDREEINKVDDLKAIKSFKSGGENNYDIVIVSDYAKGMVTTGLMDFLKTQLNTNIIVDPKPPSGYLYGYGNVFMITPNEREWKMMQAMSSCNWENIKFILETKGRDGMILHDQTEKQDWPIPSEPVNVYNVSGAGDTVVAIMAVCISMGFHALQSAIIANKCAGYVVTQPGTTTVPKNIFMKALDMFNGG
jgi:rfaE bifunctional protein kinase chain/domain